VIIWRRTRWGRHVAWLGERKCVYGAYRVLVGNPNIKTTCKT